MRLNGENADPEVAAATAEEEEAAATVANVPPVFVSRGEAGVLLDESRWRGGVAAWPMLTPAKDTKRGCE